MAAALSHHTLSTPMQVTSMTKFETATQQLQFFLLKKEFDADMKKVAVIMSTYNGEKFVREQLDSILNQTYPNIETIYQ